MRSHRWATLCGVFLASVGLALSAFARSPIDLYLSIGLISSLGHGFTGNPSVVLVVSYFKARVGLAMGILFTSMSVFSILGPIILSRLMNAFSDRICILGYAGFVALLGIPGASFFQPVEKHLKVKEDGNDMDVQKELEPISECQSNEIEEDEIRIENGGFIESESSSGMKKKSLLWSIRWDVLKSGEIWLMLFGSGISFACIFNFYYLLTKYSASILE